MKLRSVAVAFAALALSTTTALFAQAPKPSPTPAGADHHDAAPKDPFRLQPLKGNVYCLFGRGGNIGFFVGPDAVLVIDSQFKDLAPGIVEQIRKVSDRPIKFLLNTHHHGDHVGGNEVFKQFAMIVAHDNVRTRMLASPADIQRDYPAHLEEAKKAGNADMVKFFSDQIAWAKTVKIEDIPAPVMTFDSQLTIHMGDETIRVWHMPPAHTDGDSVVYFEKANVIHMGDDMFNKIIPFIDVSSGGSVAGYVAALDKVVANIAALNKSAGKVPGDVTVIPGHGEVTDLAGIKLLRQYVSDLLDAARKARAAGKSKEDFVKDVDLPAYKDWNGYKDRFKANAGSAWDEAK
jgi:glyoxylase-like metal-dependent hydrolase (beta-lactamase superfamily II)